MRWNVRIFDEPRGRWIGAVDGEDESEAKAAAILRFNIAPNVRVAVSERSFYERPSGLYDWSING